MKTMAHIDWWTCRDTFGVLHAAKIERFFDMDGVLVRMQAATACLPSVRFFDVEEDRSDWGGRKLPPVCLRDGNMAIGGQTALTLIEYGVKEAPNCVICALWTRPA